ncbi:hypothetical protein [Bacillus pacificus]|uniref:hypothetical protein n=1 Tax=Bacillus pacificus TaxID=2026187 RepID=UPI00398F9348
MTNQRYSLGKLISYISAITVCLFPIFSPYEVAGPISIGTIILLIGATFCLIIGGRIVINVPFIILLGIHSLLSMIAYFQLVEVTGTEMIIWNISMAMINSLLIMQVVPFYEKEIFIKVLTTMSIVVSLFLFYQLFIISTGNIPHNGMLFKDMVAEGKWSTSYMRPNSFFSEPSYFAIYILPILGCMLANKKYIIAILCISALVLSTSTLGIAGGLIVLLIYGVWNKRLKMIFFVITTLFIIAIICVKYLNLDWLLEFNVNKSMNIDDRSQIRFTGYIGYFDLLPTFNQIIGVGFGQLSNYFKGYNLTNYSNAFILVLINFGIIGLLTYLIYIIWSFFNSNKEGYIFIVILVLISSIDAFIYSANFYYILYFLLISTKNKLVQIRIKT